MSIEQSEMAPRSKDEQCEREATNVIDGIVINVIEAPSPGRGGPSGGGDRAVREGTPGALVMTRPRPAFYKINRPYR